MAGADLLKSGSVRLQLIVCGLIGSGIDVNLNDIWTECQEDGHSLGSVTREWTLDTSSHHFVVLLSNCFRCYGNYSFHRLKMEKSGNWQYFLSYGDIWILFSLKCLMSSHVCLVLMMSNF